MDTATMTTFFDIVGFEMYFLKFIYLWEKMTIFGQASGMLSANTALFGHT